MNIGRAQAGDLLDGGIESGGEGGGPPQRRCRIPQLDGFVEEGVAFVGAGKFGAETRLAGGQQRDEHTVIDRVSVDEVEHAVTGGIETGGDARPGDFALRRRGDGEARIAVLFGEFCQGGELALRAEVFENLGVKGVQAEDDGIHKR